MRRRWWALGLLLCGTAAPTPASAQTAPALEIRIERDTRPGILSSALVVNLTVTVTDRHTAGPPQDRFEVYANARQAAGAKTEIFPCAHERDSSPEVPPGIYLCTVLVDHGGRWQFAGVVNRLRAEPDDPPVMLGRAVTELDIVTNEIAAAADENLIQGRLLEVALLWGHAAAAALWLLVVGLVSILALPPLRRRLSPLGLHSLEVRFELMAKSLWSATGLLVASGTFLLLNQTAYETPFSAAGIEAAFRLPYGRPYFLALAAKLAVYTVMVVASVVLLREARRRLRADVVVMPVELEDVSPWRTTGPAVGSPVATRERLTVKASPLKASAVEAEPERAIPGIATAVAVLAAGTIGLSLSITLLKYFHELIEAARALL